MSNSPPDQFRYSSYGPNQDLDVLDADRFLMQLPELNSAGVGQGLPLTEQGLIIASLEDVVKTSEMVQDADLSESGVALRALVALDMGFSSVRAFQKQPFIHVQGLGQQMIRMATHAARADGAPHDIYRMTLDPYVQPWNLPNGVPVMFTGSAAEFGFLRSLNAGYFAMDEAAKKLTGVDFTSEQTADLLERLHDAAESIGEVFDPMMESFNKYFADSKSKSGGHAFAIAHRPFFESADFDGATQDAPSAAQSPLEEIELVLRGNYTGNKRPEDTVMFYKFYDHNLPYMPLHRRKVVDSYMERNGGLTYFSYIASMDPSIEKIALAEAYVHLMDKILTQRKAHNGATARDFRDNRHSDSRGGAGFDPTDLKQLAKECEANLHSMKDILTITRAKLDMAA